MDATYYLYLLVVANATGRQVVSHEGGCVDSCPVGRIARQTIGCHFNLSFPLWFVAKSIILENIQVSDSLRKTHVLSSYSQSVVCYQRTPASLLRCKIVK